MLQLKDIKKITFKGVEYLPGSFNIGIGKCLLLDEEGKERLYIYQVNAIATGLTIAVQHLLKKI